MIQSNISIFIHFPLTVPFSLPRLLDTSSGHLSLMYLAIYCMDPCIQSPPIPLKTTCGQLPIASHIHPPELHSPPENQDISLMTKSTVLYRKYGHLTSLSHPPS